MCYTPETTDFTPEQIYNAYLCHLYSGHMPYNPQGRRFKSKEAVADALRKGEIIPEIWKEVAHHTLSPAQIIGMYSLCEFSSDRAEKKFKASFISTIENFLKY